MRWPRAARATPGPPALGAVRTTRHVRIAGGGTLAPGLTLPRVGGTADAPVVLTPCDRRVRLTGPGTRPLAASRDDTLVVLDAGHGGHAGGAVAPDGTREADLTLRLASEVRRALDGRVDRVLLTRERDMDASLDFRVALADRVRADVAVSLHFDALPDTTRSRVPGAAVFGALSDPDGRRAAGVLYQSVRRYLDTLSDRVGGRWAARANRGALYREGSRGDYYHLLRASHVTWLINEPLYITRAREAALAKDAAVRRGLARAIADGVVAFLTSDEPGSGWRQPRPWPPTPPGPAPTFTCRDPR